MDRQQRLTVAETNGITTQLEFEAVVDDVATTRLLKCIEYGERRYDPALTKEFNQWMCYSDVFRKFIRLETQMRRGDASGMCETYQDLANYSLMAIQLLRR